MAREFQIGDLVRINYNSHFMVDLMRQHSGSASVMPSHGDLRENAVGQIVAMVSGISGFKYYDIDTIDGQILKGIPEFHLTLLENI